MSQKYFYKVTRCSGQSVGLNNHDVCIYYKVGGMYIPTILNSQLIGFRTKRQALEYIKAKRTYYTGNCSRLFRCLPLAPVVKIRRMSTDYSYEGFSKFWEDNKEDNRSKRKLICKSGLEENAPDGTAGCTKIRILDELPVDTQII